MQLESILSVMEKYKLTANELFLIYLTFLAQSENGDPTKNRIYFKRWYDSVGQSDLKNLFNSLKEKSIISKNYCPDSYIPDEIEFNKTFIKQYFKYSGQLGKELEDAYPSTLNINGKIVSLKNISKHFISKDDFYVWYAKTIGHNLESHNKILNLVLWAKEQNLINYGIIEFISSNKWVEIEEMKINGIENSSGTEQFYR